MELNITDLDTVGSESVIFLMLTTYHLKKDDRLILRLLNNGISTVYYVASIKTGKLPLVVIV
jgi:hypothetical protein